MKKFKRTLILAIVLTMGAVSLSACTKGNDSSTAGGESKTSSADSSESSESKESSAAESSAEAAESSSEGSIDPKTVDYSKVDIEIKYGDAEGMQKFSNEAASGKLDGKVVKVDGISAKRMSTCSIMEKNKETGVGYGLTYTLDGASSLSDYPADDARVEITGVIIQVNEYGVRNIYVLKENLKEVKE